MHLSRNLLGYVEGLFKSLFKSNYSILSFVNSNCDISDKATIYRRSRINGVKLGDYSYLGRGTVAHNVIIGKFCSISDFCTIGLPAHTISSISSSPIFNSIHNGTRYRWTNKNTFHSEIEIKIGNDVWIGYGTMVVKNVTIGDGAIIAAGSVVTKDIPPYAIVGGVPAKIIRYRFSPEIIEKLLKLQWWNLNEETLKKNLHIFQKQNISLHDLDELEL